MAVIYKLPENAVLGDTIYSEKILDIENNPIEDVRCYVTNLSDNETILVENTTNSQGIVRFQLYVGEYNLWCEKPGLIFNNPNYIEVF